MTHRTQTLIHSHPREKEVFSVFKQVSRTVVWKKLISINENCIHRYKRQKVKGVVKWEKETDISVQSVKRKGYLSNLFYLYITCVWYIIIIKSWAKQKMYALSFTQSAAITRRFSCKKIISDNYLHSLVPRTPQHRWHWWMKNGDERILSEQREPTLVWVYWFGIKFGGWT